ncbi:MAG: sulfatase-like hydrolase/transferase [Verrucomicrobia bacterium]|nr:sulfatase-like hydrolase/transferase [Verrucomicrobiota bacterium]
MATLVVFAHQGLSAPGTPATAPGPAGAMVKPNIVLILADDLGYGDVKCNNPAGKIPTPNIDRLASEGMRFTDAHAPSAVCTPTRYSILTGRYCWRTRLKAGVLWQWEAPLIPADRLTLPGLLRANGYHTAALGKWHLGLNWPYTSEQAAAKLAVLANQDKAEPGDIDWSKPITGGPIERGFDYYFGVNAPNFSPYLFIENDRIVGQPPTEVWPGLGSRLSQHAGPAQQGFDRKQTAPTLARKAVELITGAAKPSAHPLFLYFALTGPHSPIIPNDAFKGKSGIGDYGDFVMEMDWTVGEVTKALERSGLTTNTLVIFTSDNGPEHWNYEEARDFKHYAMGNLRGVKRDTWEGGHRVPFIVRWPARVKAGVTNSEVICHADLMATCAEMLGARLPDNAGEDSVSFLPALLGAARDKPLREATVHHGGNGKLAIRKNNWVFIDWKTGDANKEPAWFKQERGYQPHAFPGELYDLSQDLAERRNLYGERPEVVRELMELLEKYQRDGRSTPGVPQTNDPPAKSKFESQ